MPHTHKEIFKWFGLYFPDYSGNKAKVWFPNGKNSIRVRQLNNQEFVFTFHDHKNWKFETIESFLKEKRVDKNV